MTQRQILKNRRRFIKKYRRRIFRVLMDMISPVLGRVKEVSDFSVLLLQVDNLINSDKLEELFVDLYNDVGTFNARKVELKQEDMDLLSFWTKFVGTEILDKRIRTITDVSRNRALKAIERAIFEAEMDGLSIPETAKLIEKELVGKFKLSSRFRSERIAQTEIVTAENRGSLLGAEDIGATIKIWINSGNANVRGRDPKKKERADHWHMEGQRRKLDQDFTDPKNGHNLAYPGDVSGEAEDVINCHCTMVFE
jgi:hypothetical protein